MNYQYKLQVPISQELSKKLKIKTEELGFSSVSEVTRFLLTNLVNGNLSIAFTNGHPEEDWGDVEGILREALKEQKTGKTQKIDFSRPIHEQIMEGK